MPKLLQVSFVAAGLLMIAARASASSIVIDFDSFTDGDPVAGIIGLTFTNATVITAGISLDEFEAPPKSGNNVVFDDGGPITVDFSIPVFAIRGYFTYQGPLTLVAYDALHNVLDLVTSAFSNNLALSGETGSAPNELLEVASLTPIASFTVSVDPGDSFFALDDLTYDVPDASPAVPEPGTLSLVGLGAVLLVRRRSKGAR